MNFLKKLPLLLVGFTAVPLAGCSKYHGSVIAWKNAYTKWTEISYETSMLPFSIDKLDSQENLINGFGLLICQNGCGACKDFSQVILQFIKDTNMLVYQLNVSEDPSTFRALLDKKKDTWFNGETPSTPSFYVVHNKGQAVEIPYSKMNTLTSFTNEMKRVISFSNIYYGLAELDPMVYVNSIDKYILTIRLDSYNEAHALMFQAQIKQTIESTSKAILIIDSRSNESLTACTYEKLNDSEVKTDNPYTFDYNVEKGQKYLKSVLQK